jgi:enoyl-CoA hydratase/carnithine racemase
MHPTIELFLVDQVGPVLDVRIDRPQARDKITFVMESEQSALLKITADDNSARVVTPQNEGKTF